MFKADEFQRMPYREKYRFLMKLQSLWPRVYRSPNRVDRDVKDVVRIAKSLEQKAMMNRAPLIKIVADCFADTQDSLKHGRSGLPRVHECVLGFADTIFDLFASVLVEHDFTRDLEGYKKMDDAIMFWLQKQNSELFQVVANVWKALFFGSERAYQYLDFGQKMAGHIIGSTILQPAIPLVATTQSYLNHVCSTPLERRKRSPARTMAFVEALVVTQLLGAPKGNLRTLWVLGATDGVEGQLAREGYFEDAAAFVEGRDLQIYLVGDGLTGKKAWPPGEQGGIVSVYTYSWEDLHAGKLPDPDLVYCFNTSLGTLEPEVVKVWLPRLVDLLLYPHPTNCAVVLTCRSEAECRGERAVLACLGARIFLPTSQREHVRNLYSGMAGNLYAEYDDNAWFIPFATSLKKREELLALASDPDHFCELAAEQLKALHEKADAAKAAAEAAPRDPESAPVVKITKQPAVFWGILDLKFDPAKGIVDHVKVLETGDGRASKFSGYGAAIKESFQQENKLEGAVHRAVLVESKKLTWDMVCERGYAHIQPRQGCFPKEYTPELAGAIGRHLQLQGDDVCILKLANRARGAGVIPMRYSDLDEALQLLLQPPRDVDAWLKDRDPHWARVVTWGCFEEQVRHWWSNEYPAFLVEDFCTSRPTLRESEDECLELDGTMRVGFSLHRDAPEGLPDGFFFTETGIMYRSPDGNENIVPLKMNTSGDMITELWGTIRPFSHLFPVGPDVLRIQWLGGYWKLPMEDRRSPDLRGRIVSVAKHGTAPVAAADLHEVYAALGDSMPQIFSMRHEINHTSLLKRYSGFPELGAASIARLASSMRARDKVKALNVFNLAQSKIEKLRGRASNLANSYILRNLGVIEAQSGRWKDAEVYFSKSLGLMPASANSRYLLGMCSLDAGNSQAAIEAFEGSLQLDPDFKAPYVGIAVAQIRLQVYDKAAEVSESGLKRFPQTAHILYNLGAAKFALSCAEEEEGHSEESWKSATCAELREEAFTALTAARDLASQAWTERDERMLAHLEERSKYIPFPASELPKDGWRFYGWRP